MKQNVNIFLVSILIAFASCSFTSKSFDNPDKDKLLMQLVTYLLEEGHLLLHNKVLPTSLVYLENKSNYLLKNLLKLRRLKKRGTTNIPS